MFAKLLALVISLSALTSIANADLVEGITGATKKEREIRWLWKYTGEMIRACAKATTSDCQKPEIQPLIAQLSAQFAAEPERTTSAWNQRLNFVAESDRPDLFRSVTNESHRLAMTDLKAGAPIFINTDRMDAQRPDQWVGILVHEAVHGLGIDDDSRRLPDNVGAAVAAFVDPYLIESTLAEFGHPESGSLTFSDPSFTRPARALSAFLNITSDNDLIPNARVPICTGGAVFRGQMVEAPLWRVVYLRGDKALAKMRGSARVTSLCGDQKVLTGFVLIFDLNFDKPFDPRGPWWNLPSKFDAGTISGGNTDGQDVLVDVNRTFAIESITPSKRIYSAGDTWSSRIIVRSTDGFLADTCRGFFTASKWFFNRMVSTAMFEEFQTCVLTPLGGDRYQADVSYPLPSGVQPDLFTLSFLHFTGPGKSFAPDRFALRSKPSYVQVGNPAAAPALQITDWNVENLPPRAAIMGRPLNKSYSIQINQPFWIDFDIRGVQKIKRQFIDFDFIVTFNGETVLMPLNSSAEEISTIILKTEITPTADGLGQHLRYQVVVTPVVNKVVALGFRLRRLSLETSDFSWSEIETPNYSQGWFLTNMIP